MLEKGKRKKKVREEAQSVIVELTDLTDRNEHFISHVKTVTQDMKYKQSRCDGVDA